MADPNANVDPNAEPQEPVEPQKPVEPSEPQEPAEPQEPTKKKQTAQERIDELTYKYREMERVSAEKDEQTRLLLDQNKQLLERFDAFEGRFEDEREPDRFEEPQKHDEWLMKKLKREVMKDFPQQKPQESQPFATGQKISPEQLQNQEASMRVLYDDYDDVIEEAKKDMQNDPMLRSEVWQSSSPPKIAYQYVMKKRERAKQQRDTSLDQQFVEGGTPAPGPEPRRLSKDQMDVADKMGISHEDYKKQLDIIEGRASE